MSVKEQLNVLTEIVYLTYKNALVELPNPPRTLFTREDIQEDERKKRFGFWMSWKSEWVTRNNDFIKGRYFYLHSPNLCLDYSAKIRMSGKHGSKYRVRGQCPGALGLVQ